MNRILQLLGCSDWREFGAMCICLVLMTFGAAILFLPVVMSPMWWPQ